MAAKQGEELDQTLTEPDVVWIADHHRFQVRHERGDGPRISRRGGVLRGALHNLLGKRRKCLPFGRREAVVVIREKIFETPQTYECREIEMIAGRKLPGDLQYAAVKGRGSIDAKLHVGVEVATGLPDCSRCRSVRC